MSITQHKSDFIIIILLLTTALALSIILSPKPKDRLIGLCNNQILTAEHEDEFPINCTTIKENDHG